MSDCAFCSKCGVLKEFEEFGKSSFTIHGHRNGACKACRSKEYYASKNKKKNPEHLRNCRVHITHEAYDLLFKRQNGCCAICGVKQDKLSYSLAVDHNHKTGVVRGLLCHNCNQGLGDFKSDDGINLLQIAISYIKRADHV